VENVTALILAGGQGTRLRGALPGIPKVLAPVCGRPFLSYLLDQLRVAGILDVVLCTGYRADQVFDAFGPRYHDLDLRYSRESQPLGTAGALRLALEHTESQRLLVLNGDSYVNILLEKFDRWHVARESTSRGSLLLTWTNEPSRFGTVEVGPGANITAFREKCATSVAGWINAGVYFLARSLVESIHPERNTSLETEMFPLWLERGLGGFTVRAPLIDIGTPESFAQAEAFMAECIAAQSVVRSEPRHPEGTAKLRPSRHPQPASPEPRPPVMSRNFPHK
jgi:D-glycero-alpha-D-manno-heptose 1-phosphate guanylyltransferase